MKENASALHEQKELGGLRLLVVVVLAAIVITTAVSAVGIVVLRFIGSGSPNSAPSGAAHPVSRL